MGTSRGPLLELHVWGPAFGLPSLDPQCLAAIAYLQGVVPSGKWALLASSDPALSPTNELPVLRNGEIWIGGFRNICHYLAELSAGEWVLDAGLPEKEGADCIAYSSFVEAQGQLLLDLSLYVSSQNYAVTRPIYNTLQPFPMQYLTPSAVRTAAKKRTAHLQLSALDVDTAEEKHTSGESIIPNSLRTPNISVSRVLAADPESNSRIRLEALAADFFEPLQELLEGKQYMLSTKQFSSLDCLALGYLSLMIIPGLPSPWLAQSLQHKFPVLCTWATEFRSTVLGAKVNVRQALLQDVSHRNKLPWKAPEGGSALAAGGVFLGSLADSMPVLGDLRRKKRMLEHGVKTSHDEPNSIWGSVVAWGGTFAGAALLVGLLVRKGAIQLPAFAREEQKRDTYGEAEHTLFAFAEQMDSRAQRQAL